MFTKIKISISVKKALQLLVILNSIKVEDPLLDYVFTMNAKSLAPINETFTDKKNGLVLLHAKEKDGVLQREGNEYVYSKDGQTKLEEEVKKAGEELVEVELLQVDITKRPKAQELSRIVKSAFMDSIFIASAPEFEEEKTV